MADHQDWIEIEERDRFFAFLFLLPIEMSRHVSRAPLVTMVLIGARAVGFGYQILDIDGGASLYLNTLVVSRATLYQVVTSAFMHGNLLHLLGNMYFLYAFGRLIEDRIGQIGYLMTYMTCGIAAGAVFMWGHLGDDLQLMGASGAVSGILGVYFILFPFRLVGWSIIFTVVRIPAFIYLVFWFLVQSQLWESGVSGVAYEAHIGGFMAGALIGAAIRLNLFGLNRFLVDLPDFQTIWKM